MAGRWLAEVAAAGTPPMAGGWLAEVAAAAAAAPSPLPDPAGGEAASSSPLDPAPGELVADFQPAPMAVSVPVDVYQYS
uniref:Uncharacterized protein n=1 Tax=Oryza sativa subsp. japonica TaxID=39947 RepID=Q60DA2_ORYSJ|nr:hypothetical protein [Oryza sativa Japonica Group]